MKSKIGDKSKVESKYLLHSKSPVYHLMNHESYEKKSIPLNLNTLGFVNESLNKTFYMKLYADEKGNINPDFVKTIRNYYAFTTLSLLFFILYLSLEKSRSSLLGPFLVINIICVISLLLLCYLLLILVFYSKKALHQSAFFYTCIIILKIMYFMIADQRILCEISNNLCAPGFSIMSLMIMSEIVLARNLMFHKFSTIVTIGAFTSIALFIIHFIILSENSFMYMSEFCIITLFIFLQSSDCYKRDFRMKQIFWREEQEDLAISVIKISGRANTDDMNILDCCDDILSNLKYFSKVIIYKDTTIIAKDTIKQMRALKKILAKKSYTFSEIKLENDIDPQDYTFILQNFMSLQKAQKPIKHSPAHIFHSSSLITSQNYGVTELQSALYHFGKSWSFDIFLIYNTTGKSISVVSSYLLSKWGLLEDLNIPEQVSENYFLKLEEVRYNQAYNPLAFHNSCHAADILHVALCFFLDNKIKVYLNSYDMIAIMISSLAYDVGHPGLSNRFLIASKHQLTFEYNDTSVLENMHCALAFKIMTYSDCDIFQCFSNYQYTECRKLIIEIILSSDMTKHFDVIGSFRTRALHVADLDLKNQQDKTILLTFAIKFGDIGYAAKDKSLHEKWRKLALEEMFLQGDIEKEQGLNVSVFCDRNNCDVHKCNIWFVSSVALPVIEVCAQYLESEIFNKVILKQAMENLEFWQSSFQLKMNTGVFIKKLPFPQLSPINPKTSRRQSAY